MSYTVNAPLSVLQEIWDKLCVVEAYFHRINCEVDYLRTMCKTDISRSAYTGYVSLTPEMQTEFTPGGDNWLHRMMREGCSIEHAAKCNELLDAEYARMKLHHETNPFFVTAKEESSFDEEKKNAERDIVSKFLENFKKGGRCDPISNRRNRSAKNSVV